MPGDIFLAKALDGVWPVVHACAVQHWVTAAGGGCPSTALHRHDQLAIQCLGKGDLMSLGIKSSTFVNLS